MYFKYYILSLLYSFSALAQLECPNLDICFPETSGHNLIVPSEEYPSIQDAINAAPNGANIKIKGGLHKGNFVIFNKDLNIIGNHSPKRPTILQGMDFNLPIFNIYGAPFVKFKNMNLTRTSSAIKSQSYDDLLASISLNQINVSEVDRGIVGSYDWVEIDRSKFISGLYNGISLSEIIKLDIRGSMFRDYKGYGLYVQGNQGSVINISFSNFENNLNGGMIVRNNAQGIIINKVVAKNNGVAGIILENTGQSYIQRSELANNRRLDGKYGSGLVLFSTKIQVSQTSFINNEGFETTLVGCGTSPKESFVAEFINNTFSETDTGLSVVFAIYPSPGCSTAPYGSLIDGGRNICHGTSLCKAETAGGSLAPMPPKP